MISKEEVAQFVRSMLEDGQLIKKEYGDYYDGEGDNKRPEAEGLRIKLSLTTYSARAVVPVNSGNIVESS